MSRISALCISALVASSACGGQVSVSPSDVSDASDGTAGQFHTADAQAGSGGAQDGSAGAWIKDSSAGAPSDSATDSEPMADTSCDMDGAIEASADAGADHDAVAEADSESEADAPDDAVIDSGADDSEDGPEMVDADASESPQCQIDAPFGLTPVCPEYSCITCSDQEQPLCAEVCAVHGCFHCDAGDWHIRSIACESGCSDAGPDVPLEDGGPDGACAPPGCVIAPCRTFSLGALVLECGDCADNDADGLIDMDDPDCTGPCDWNEVNFGHAPGASDPPCVIDCFFDDDFGSGNDGCSWNHRCDPLAKSVPAMPEVYCKYDSSLEAKCQSLSADQGSLCNALCEPITPNGCDCFGCCEHPAGSGSFVWLGSATCESYHHHCSMAMIDDPAWCHPCTPVPSCFNPCEGCELCFGMTALAAGCDQQQCASGSQPCGLPCQPHCPAGQFCLTGCCIATPSW